MVRVAALVVLAALLAAGCTPPVPTAGPTGLATLAPDQRLELLRVVTPVEWPRLPENNAIKSPFEIAISTGAADEIHLTLNEKKAPPVELTFTIADRRPVAADTSALLKADTLTRLSYEVVDFYGRKVAGENLGFFAVPPGGGERKATLAGLTQAGYYEAVAHLTLPDKTELTARQGFALINAMDDAVIERWTPDRARANQGTATRPSESDDASPQLRAWSLVHSVAAALSASDDLDLPATATHDPACAAVLAPLATMLDQTHAKTSVWPRLPLVKSPVFASKDRAVAVLWTESSGDPAAGPAERGLLIIPDGDTLEAFDCLGQSIGLWRGRSLLLPLGEAPIYVTSRVLSAAALAAKLAPATMKSFTPLAVRVLPLAAPVGPQSSVTLELVALIPGGSDVTVETKGPEGWLAADAPQKVHVDPEHPVRLAVRFNKAVRRVENSYPFLIRLKTADWKDERALVAQEAVDQRAAKGK